MQPCSRIQEAVWRISFSASTRDGAVAAYHTDALLLLNLLLGAVLLDVAVDRGILHFLILRRHGGRFGGR